MTDLRPGQALCRCGRILRPSGRKQTWGRLFHTNRGDIDHHVAFENQAGVGK